MRKFRLIGVAGLAVAAVAIPAASAEAKQTKSACPKGWQAVGTQAVPPTQQSRDRNGNFIVCAKPVAAPGNPHINTKDDRTNETVPPFLWTSLLLDNQDPLQDIWLTINNLDNSGHYYLDPAPTDYDDDVELP